VNLAVSVGFLVVYVTQQLLVGHRRFPGDDWGIETKSPTLNPVEHLARGRAQRTLTCGRGNQDRLAQWYCAGETAPVVTGIEDLMVALGVKDLANPNAMLFALTSHSSSLVTRSTSVLNPRAVVFSQPGELDYLAVGFVRGDGFAEVAAFDPSKQQINFYLVSYKKGCEPECSNVERFTPVNESGWMDVTIYNDQDLKNSVVDCLQCHQPEGSASGQRILRMQELQDPWTHWFRNNRGTNPLLQTFRSTHVNEDYAAIPAGIINNSDPADLEDFVRDGGFGNQPNEFSGDQVNADDITVDTPNATWLGYYENAV
jgi:hypothetical protein